jgi:hypothetical protein
MPQRHVWVRPHVVLFGAGGAAHTITVSYDKERWWTIAERYNAGNWTHRKLMGAAGPDDAELKGDYQATIGKAGDVYEVVVLPYELHESDFPSRLDAKEARAIWETHYFYDFGIGVGERIKLIVDSGAAFGGTWLDPVAYLNDTATVAISVGTVAPVAKPNAPHDFGNLNNVVYCGVTHSAKQAAAQVRNLLPGHDYWVVIVAVTPTGAWDEVVSPIRLRQRNLEVTATHIHVINDGDPGGSSEIDFSYEFVEGNPHLPGVPESTILSGAIPEGNYTDGQDIPLQKSYASGPVASERTFLKVTAGGTDHDGWFEPDENALGTDQIDYPSGPTSEEFSRSEDLIAYPLNGDMTFALHYDVKVTYT